MTLTQALLTMLGGFLLPFIILMVWGRLVAKWRGWGGFLAAFLIIGPVWLVNHGLEQALIHQTGPIFVDMGLATAIGIFVFGLLQGQRLKKAKHLLLSCLLGGILAGFALALLF